ncbi:serine/threonine protein kinase [Gemmata sp. G18]|uniref:Serine/threonine protein kinase n=1 Tax=Gemmata palustris TaxID=2822762 RepID=A0ABS5BKE7_9BACT|nr:serine/threonine-protein kinase [Gemmata palustris]MBP3954182.1 serine/threonine protein kinase [Gemmata palustris]
MDGTPEAPQIDPPACPTPAALAAFLSDGLPPPEMDEIGAHVSSCASCDAVVRRMDKVTDNYWRSRRAPENEVGPHDPTQAEYPHQTPAGRALPATQIHYFVPKPPEQLGQYRIGERLGQGGMGTVYRAEHVRLKKYFAVKVLSASQMWDHRAVARFQLEMEVIGRLDHPNIVRATDAGDADGMHFLVMELIEGSNLAKLVGRGGPLPVPVACELVRQAALGLQHAHEHGLVHRDVKPSNLMLSASGQVKVLDLGLALLRSNDPAPDDDLTGIGEVMGTAEYMAPEQWANTHAVDIRADIYSLGCTLYALLTGDPPFAGTGRKSFMRLMAAHQTEPAPPITTRRPEIPPALAALLERMLAKNPDLRPATPGEVADELKNLSDEKGLPDLSAVAGADTDAEPDANRLPPASDAPTPTPVYPATLKLHPRPNRTRRRWIAALVLALVAGGIGAYTALAPAPVPAQAKQKPEEKEEPHDPKKWRNLLTARPGERLWRPSAISTIDHNPKTEILTVRSQGKALLRLGETKAKGYKLQIGLQQIRWVGGIGIYFGGGSPSKEPNEFRCQLIHLVNVGLPGDAPKYSLDRSRGDLMVPPGAKPDLGVLGFFGAFVEPPVNKEHLLELEVRPDCVWSIRWNGIECQELVSEKAFTKERQRLPDPHLTGEFGIYCNGADLSVLTARYVETE